MAKFRVENLLQMLSGAQQGKFQARQQMQSERQAQQAQALSILPQLLAQAERQRQAALEPFDMAAGAPNQTPESLAATTAAAQAARRNAGALPDPGALYAQILGSQKGPVNVDLGAFRPGGDLGAAPAPVLRDPRAEAALEDEVALLKNDFQSRVNPSQGLPLLGALRRGENILARTPDPRSSVPTIDTPDSPSAYERAIENNPTSAEAAAKERAALEAEKQKGRVELAGNRAQEAAKLAGLKAGTTQHVTYVRGYATLYQKALEETGNPAYAEQVAEQAMSAALRTAPAVKTPGQEALAATLNPKIAELPKFESRKMSMTRQGDEKIAQGAQALDLKEKDTLSKITDRELNAKDRRVRADAYTRKVAADLDPNVVGGQAWYRQNVIQARQNTEARLARQAAGGGGVQKWNPGLTARVDSAENAVKNAETVLAQTISAFQKEEADAAKASGMPSKHNYVVLDLDKLDKDLAAGKIKPTMKVGGKDVPNPQYDKFVRLNNLYRGVKVQRQKLNETLDTLAPVNAPAGGGAVKPGTGSQPLKTGLPDVNERVRKPSTPLSDVERKAVKMLQGSTNPNAGRPFTYAEAERLIRAQR